MKVFFMIYNLRHRLYDWEDSRIVEDKLMVSSLFESREKALKDLEGKKKEILDQIGDGFELYESRSYWGDDEPHRDSMPYIIFSNEDEEYRLLYSVEERKV